MINVPVQILFSSNKKVNENRQQLIEKMSEKKQTVDRLFCGKMAARSLDKYLTYLSSRG